MTGLCRPALARSAEVGREDTRCAAAIEAMHDTNGNVWELDARVISSDEGGIPSLHLSGVDAGKVFR